MECSRVLDKSSKTIQYISVLYDIFTLGMFHFRPQRKWDELIRTAVQMRSLCIVCEWEMMFQLFLRIFGSSSRILYDNIRARNLPGR